MQTIVDPAVEADYRERGWWGTDCLTDVIRRHAFRHQQDFVPRNLALERGEHAFQLVHVARLRDDEFELVVPPVEPCAHEDRGRQST